MGDYGLIHQSKVTADFHLFPSLDNQYEKQTIQ